ALGAMRNPPPGAANAPGDMRTPPGVAKAPGDMRKLLPGEVKPLMDGPIRGENVIAGRAPPTAGIPARRPAAAGANDPGWFATTVFGPRKPFAAVTARGVPPTTLPPQWLKTFVLAVWKWPAVPNGVVWAPQPDQPLCGTPAQPPQAQ